MAWALLLLHGCPEPCVGVGCEEEFSAARAGFLTGFADGEAWEEAPTSPLETSLDISGDSEQGADWDLLLDPGGVVLGVPADGIVYRFDPDLRGSVGLDKAEAALAESQEGSELGAALAWVEGLGLLVGAPGWQMDRFHLDNGAVYLLPAAGEADLPDSLDDAQLTVTGDEDGGRLGDVVAGCADMDGDGLGEWAAAAPRDSSSQTLAGRVILALSAETQGESTLSTLDLPGSWVGSALGDAAGRAIGCRHDLSAREGRAGAEAGTPDLLIGAPFAEAGESGDATGVVYLIDGETRPSGPLFEVASRTLAGLEDDSWLGWSLATGDIDGDGYYEIAAGAPGGAEGAGEVLIWEGEEFAEEGVDLPRYRLRGEDRGDGFGTSVDLADLDGDGRDELIAGAPKHNPLNEAPSAYNSGRLYIFAGSDRFLTWSPLRDASDAEVILSHAQQYLRTGQLARTGDFNGDGLADIGLLHRAEGATR